MKRTHKIFINALMFCFFFAGCKRHDMSMVNGHPLSQMDKYMDTSERLEQEGESYTDNPLLPTTLNDSSYSIDIPSYQLSIQAEQMDVRQFYMSLVEGTNINMIISPAVSGKISFVAHEMPIEEILEIVYEQYGFPWSKNHSGYLIEGNQVETKTYNISYLAISRQSDSVMSVSGGSNQTNISTNYESDVMKELQESLDHLIGEDESASYQINRSSGLLVMHAEAKIHKKVEEFLVNLRENLHHQVLIEAKIIEVRLSDQYKQGIDWSSIFANEQIAAGQIGSGSLMNSNVGQAVGQGNSALVNLTDLNNRPVDGFGKFLWDSFQTAQMGGIFKIGLFKNNFKFVLDLLAGQGQVQVLSSPRITTLNNQKALIRVGEEKKFLTQLNSSRNEGIYRLPNGEIASRESSNPGISFQTYFSGIALVVMPHIIDDGNLILHVHPSISTISEEKKTYTINGQTYEFHLPSNDIRESDSVIRVENEQIVVLGGLMKSEEHSQNAYVPFLKSAPIFDHEVSAQSKSELVILIKPFIVTAESSKEIIRKQRESLQAFNSYVLLER
jgi:MSHA biogenesis protein MshL